MKWITCKVEILKLLHGLPKVFKWTPVWNFIVIHPELVESFTASFKSLYLFNLIYRNIKNLQLSETIKSTYLFDFVLLEIHLFKLRQVVKTCDFFDEVCLQGQHIHIFQMADVLDNLDFVFSQV